MSRLITFFRHATAQDRALEIEDEKRTLVKKGRKQAQRVATFCQRMKLRPRRLLCSPVVRARETADIFSENLTGCPAPEVADWLRYESAPAEACQRIRQEAQQEDCDTWLVGHEPDFSLIIGELLGTAVPPIVIKKASITRLEVGDTPATTRILWSIPCQLLR
jgi:phosphohistidine phosphatase